MLKGRLELLAAAGAAALLSGCATNTIRLDRTTAMGKAGTAATDGTRALMEQVRAANREALIDLVSVDADCTLPSPRIAGGRSADDPKFCHSGLDQPGDFLIRRWTYRDFKPALAVIDGLAAYLGAVDAIVTRKPLDIVAEVAAAEAKLRAVAGDLNTIAGVPGVPDLTTEQRSAVIGTLDLLSEILDEADRVRDLKKIELNLDQVQFEQNLVALDRANATLLKGLTGQLSNQRTLLTFRAREAKSAPFADRRPLVARNLDLIETQEALPEFEQALSLAVAAFRKAHTDYRALLFDGGASLSQAEKRKKATVAQARVLAALNNLASLIKAF